MERCNTELYKCKSEMADNTQNSLDLVSKIKDEFRKEISVAKDSASKIRENVEREVKGEILSLQKRIKICVISILLLIVFREMMILDELKSKPDTAELQTSCKAMLSLLSLLLVLTLSLSSRHLRNKLLLNSVLVLVLVLVIAREVKLFPSLVSIGLKSSSVLVVLLFLGGAVLLKTA